jgi:D-arabinan exo alpha-(1,3)/(1,5)-arabinofuranosidase (non-reducing end)
VRLPAALTAGKSRITVRVEFASSWLDWNEFTYWTYSTLPDGSVVATDTLDVGDPASETAHGYTITEQTWSGSLVAGYDTADLLNNTRLRVFWDGEAAPSVDAPLGSFFGMGQFGAHHVRALPVGIDSTDTLYCYLPMPFRQQATIDLISTRTLPTVGVTAEVRHQPETRDFADLVYFRTRFTATTPTAVGQDVPVLDAAGSGSFIGVTASFAGDALRSYLEGDERIYVDDDNTPAFYGTGTEDFFNGGFYFDHGPYTQPLSGNPAHLAAGGIDRTSAYRFFLQDAVPFRRRIRVSLQHGGHNEATADVWTLAYYYQQPATTLQLTDTLDVATAGSEGGHGYRITTPTWSGIRTYQYEGAADTVDVTDNGRAHRGTSQFTLAISPLNSGVLLRRRFDQTIANQRADVIVDGQPVGAWYVAGNNPFDQWRDTDFLIPPTVTAGKTTITVTLRFVSSSLDWNEFTYWAYTLTQ